jgi:hypothetical protein
LDYVRQAMVALRQELYLYWLALRIIREFSRRSKNNGKVIAARCTQLNSQWGLSRGKSDMACMFGRLANLFRSEQTESIHTGKKRAIKHR